MMIQWEKYLCTVNDIYAENKYMNTEKEADVHCYFQQRHYINYTKYFTLHKKVKTLSIDLNKSIEQLRKDLNRTTRYQINKAGRDQLVIKYSTDPSEEDLQAFSEFYNVFAKEKGIGLCKNHKLKGLQKNKHLTISYAYHQNGTLLCSHLYIVDGLRATMLYSCSTRLTSENIQPIQIGRANRYLHWQDISYFKEQQYKVYDFCGLSTNMQNKEQQNINNFKKGFGGYEEDFYQSYVPITMKGYIIMILLRLKWIKDLELVNRKTIIREKQLSL